MHVCVCVHVHMCAACVCAQPVCMRACTCAACMRACVCARVCPPPLSARECSRGSAGPWLGSSMSSGLQVSALVPSSAQTPQGLSRQLLWTPTLLRASGQCGLVLGDTLERTICLLPGRDEAGVLGKVSSGAKAGVQGARGLGGREAGGPAATQPQVRVLPVSTGM